MKKKYRWQIDKKAKTEKKIAQKKQRYFTKQDEKANTNNYQEIKPHLRPQSHPSNAIELNILSLKPKKMSSIYSFPAQYLLKTDKIQNRIKNLTP